MGRRTLWEMVLSRRIRKFVRRVEGVENAFVWVERRRVKIFISETESGVTHDGSRDVIRSLEGLTSYHVSIVSLFHSTVRWKHSGRCRPFPRGCRNE